MRKLFALAFVAEILCSGFTPATRVVLSPTNRVVIPVYRPAGLAFLQYNGLGTNSALGVTNSKTLTYSEWIMGTYDTTNDTTLLGNELWSDTNTLCEVSGGTAKGICNSIDNNAGRFQLNFNNSVGVTNGTDALKFVGTAGANGIWHHYLLSMDTVNQVSAFYIDGVNQAIAANPLPLNQIPDLNNSAGFHIAGVDTAQPAVSMQYHSELVIAEVSVVCPSVGQQTMNGIPVSCTKTNIIPPKIVKLFNSGRTTPVDLGPGCGLPFGGRQAEVCVNNESGAANGGSGGALTPFVSTASYGAVVATPYGPGGIPGDQPTMRWLQAKKNATVVTNGMTTNAGSMPIVPSDLIIILAGISNSSGSTNYNMTCPTGGANTWHQVGPGNDTFESVNAELCWTIAQVGDISGAWRVTWDAGGAVRGHDWEMYDYANVSSIDQAGFLFNGPTTTTNHKTAAGLTTVNNKETVFSAVVDWDAAVNIPWLPPGTGTLRYRLPDVGSPLQIITADEYAVASGSNPQRTFTSGSAVTSIGFTLTLVH